MADQPQFAPIEVYLTVRGGDAASKFYQKAFGAIETSTGAPKSNAGCTAGAISSIRSRTSTICTAPVLGCTSILRRSAQR